jgi:hypothetical protein
MREIKNNAKLAVTRFINAIASEEMVSRTPSSYIVRMVALIFQKARSTSVDGIRPTDPPRRLLLEILLRKLLAFSLL